VKLLPVHCPRCNSRQKFSPHSRKLADGTTEKYIVCHMCKLESIVDIGKPRRARRTRLVPEVR